MAGTSPLTAAQVASLQGVPGNASPSGSGPNPLSIGAVTFRSEECPASPLGIGGAEQMLVTTDLIGGGRVVQALGVKATDVAWSGQFLTISNVFAKVRSLRLYVVSGQEVLLSWWGELYFCRVKQFVPKFDHENRCHYDITVTITRDANGAFTVAANTTIDRQIQGLLNSATESLNAITAQLGLPPGQAAPTAFQKMQAAAAALSGHVQAAGPIASNITVAGPPITAAANNATAAAAQYIAGLSPSDPTLANAMLAQSAFQLVAANVQRGQSPQTITVQGGNLFQISSQVYGDAGKAYDLATANGLPSPFISAAVSSTIALPPFGSKV